MRRSRVRFPWAAPREDGPSPAQTQMGGRSYLRTRVTRSAVPVTSGPQRASRGNSSLVRAVNPTCSRPEPCCPEHVRRQDPPTVGAVNHGCDDQRGDSSWPRRRPQGPRRDAPPWPPGRRTHHRVADVRGGTAWDHPGGGHGQIGLIRPAELEDIYDRQSARASAEASVASVHGTRGETRRAGRPVLVDWYRYVFVRCSWTRSAIRQRFRARHAKFPGNDNPGGFRHAG